MTAEPFVEQSCELQCSAQGDQARLVIKFGVGRVLLSAMLLALAACAHATQSSAAGENQERLLTLSWTGTGKVYVPGKVLDLGVRTIVVPFTSARSDSWVITQGPSSMRSMIIEVDGAWLERDKKRNKMPAQMLRQERQQFAIYGQMQMALRRAPTAVSRGVYFVTIPGNGTSSVDTRFQLDRNGKIVAATNSVDDAEVAGKRVEQLFHFSGEIVSHGLRWPRRIEIYQGDKPYFDLEIDSLHSPYCEQAQSMSIGQDQNGKQGRGFAQQCEECPSI